jgi:hypothetical protein
MKVFISWSGSRSKQIAKILHDWLPIVLQNIEAFMSTEEIEKGVRWFSNIATELENCNFGLVCLTPENLTAPWIHFEAGALAKAIDHSRVVPLLFQLKPSEIQGPLAQFNAANFEREDVMRLLKSISNAAGEEGLDERRLDKTFAAFWSQLDDNIRAIPKIAQDDKPDSESHSSRDPGSILEEILVLVRQQSIASSDITALLQANSGEPVDAPNPSISNIKLVEYTDPSGPPLGDSVPPGAIPKFCRVLPYIDNFGRTSVRIARVSMNWIVSAALPPNPTYKAIENLSFLLGPNMGIWFRVDPIGDIKLTDDERHKIDNGLASLWVFGAFSYRDVFGKSYNLGFVARWDLAGGFAIESHPNYTYDSQ